MNPQPLVAIVGNPNAGKTSLFNSLTGSHQKVANYPGVTVERISATLQLEGQTVECLDIPGLYSLEAQSMDEQVAVDAVMGRGEERVPDLLVCVLNAANLERNLFLFSQVAEQGIPVVVALTMTDLLREDGKAIDAIKLSNLLGVDVIPVIGHRGQGVDLLKETIARNLEDGHPPSPTVEHPAALEEEVTQLAERLARVGMDVSRDDIRRALRSADDPFAARVGEIPEISAEFDRAREKLQASGVFADHRIVADRYKWAGSLTSQVIASGVSPRKWRSDRLDKVLTHRFFGLIIFATVMYGVFQAIYTFAGPMMDAIEGCIGWFGGLVGGLLEGQPMIQSLVVDGIIAGIGSVLVFLPQILILFALIAVLEGTGYLARAAFLMDRLLGWCGLNGRAFIPLLSSFACAIPGIMAARVMPDPKSRLATILVAPLMSCSARLPVYILLIGAFIEPEFGAGWAGFALFAMHFLGLAIAVPVVLVLNKGIIKGRRLPFLLELPPYQWPRLRDVLLAMYFRGKVFLVTAGTIIFVMSIVIWALSSFPRSAEAEARYEQEHRQAQKEGSIDAYVQQRQLEDSFLGRFGRTIEPVFIPAGYDWRITTAILCAFPAREVVVPSMGIMFAVGGDADEESVDLRKALDQATWPDGRKLMTPWTAVGLMVFFALCAQCMSTLATVKRETNSWGWPVFMFVYMSGLAYLLAVAIHQVGLRVGG
ncbi:MAG: ferrous iron transport protein B [Methanoregulaceae archaeon]|nr:ferrous iron transport protein B [Methanoregulaceae archaeon]